MFTGKGLPRESSLIDTGIDKSVSWFIKTQIEVSCPSV